jgi:pimeloyl-ACP methyl ester carboxylesterase
MAAGLWTTAKAVEHLPEPKVGAPVSDPSLRLLASRMPIPGARRAVLYVHGATFPSALSVAHRFDGRAWRDALGDAGFDVWGLDFYGFGHSDNYPEMNIAAEENPPLGLAEAATAQLAAAVRFVLEHQCLTSLSLIAHSWGSMVAGRFAGDHPALVDRLVLFAPIARRDPPRYSPRPNGPAWRLVSVEDQWARFVEDVPPDEPPVLSRIHFGDWAQRYLDIDPHSRTRDPAAVKTPSGPFVEILRAWHGELAYDLHASARPWPSCAVLGMGWSPMRMRDGYSTPSATRL